MAIIGKTINQLAFFPVPVVEDCVLAISDPSYPETENVAYKVRLGDLIVSPVDPDKIKTKSIREDDGDVYYGYSTGNISVDESHVGLFTDISDYDDIDVGDVVFIGVSRPYADRYIDTVIEKLGSMRVQFSQMEQTSGGQQFEVAKTRLYIGKLAHSHFQTPIELSYLSVGAKRTYVGGELTVEKRITAENLTVEEVVTVEGSIETPTVYTQAIESSTDMSVFLRSGGGAETISISTELVVGENTGIDLKVSSDVEDGGRILLSAKDIDLICSGEASITAAGGLSFNVPEMSFSSLVIFEGGITADDCDVKIKVGDLKLYERGEEEPKVTLTSAGVMTFRDFASIDMGTDDLTTITCPTIIADAFTGGSFKADKTNTIESFDGAIKTTGSGNIETTDTGSIFSAKDIKSTGGGQIFTTGEILGGTLSSTSEIISAGDISGERVYTPTIETDEIRSKSHLGSFITFNPDNGMPDYTERPAFCCEQWSLAKLGVNNKVNTSLKILDGDYIEQKERKGIDKWDPDSLTQLKIVKPGVYEYEVSIRFEAKEWASAVFVLFVHRGFDNALRADSRVYYCPGVSATPMLTYHGFVELKANDPFWIDVYQNSGATRYISHSLLYIKYASENW